MWMNIVASSGKKNAVENRDALSERMTSAQIAEGQALADEWWDKHTFQRALEELDLREAEWWEEHNN